MKKWKKYLRNSGGIFLLLFGFAQCNLFNLGDKEEVFDPYEHPLIEKGDTLVYESIDCVDSFYVSESEVYKPHMNPTSEESDVTEYCGTIHEICASDATKICFDINIISSIYDITHYMCYYYYTGGEDNWVFNFIKKENSGYSYTLGSYELCDLYKTPWFKNDEKIFEGKVDSVLYSKTYGIIKYWRNNENYVLTEKCLEILMARE